jgi:hypothetical protein
MIQETSCEARTKRTFEIGHLLPSSVAQQFLFATLAALLRAKLSADAKGGCGTSASLWVVPKSCQSTFHHLRSQCPVTPDLFRGPPIGISSRRSSCITVSPGTSPGDENGNFPAHSAIRRDPPLPCRRHDRRPFLLGDNPYAEFRRLLQLRSRIRPRNHQIGRLRDRARRLGAQSLGLRLGLIAAHRQ